MTSIGTKFIIGQQFIFDPNNNSLSNVSDHDSQSRLGNNENRILTLFAERPNQVISRDELHEFVWREQGVQVDDSSLTQAISTLRKILSDSTKSPLFIKTVPKRGYQFIATVENIVPLASGDKESTEHALPTKLTAAVEKELETEKNREHETLSTTITGVTAKRTQMVYSLLLLVSLLLPIMVYVTIEPAPSKFRLLDTIDSIPLKTPKNHPSLERWTEVLSQCVTIYLSKQSDKPTEIIATEGANKNLILNYVHSEVNSQKNVTIQLLAEQHELTELCGK